MLHVYFCVKRIKVSQIIDLFPMLKELYDKGPQDAFYVVKVWVSHLLFAIALLLNRIAFTLGQYELSRKYSKCIPQRFTVSSIFIR